MGVSVLIRGDCGNEEGIEQGRRKGKRTKELLRRLAQHHGAKQLAAQPASAAGRDRGLDDGDLEVRACLAQHVRGGQAAGARAHDDDVRLRVLVQVGEVAARHGAGHLRLADRGEAEAVPFGGEGGEEGGVRAGGRGWRGDRAVMDGEVLDTLDGRHGVDVDGVGGGWRSHGW